jgi:SAM-dependent methyltransferase
MSSERVFPLDRETVELFALKGTQGACGTCIIGNANGVKVRRVVQLIRDFSKKPFDQLRILDLACGEGVYAIEAALHGAEVRALDARTERMNEGAKAAERLGLQNLCFEQNDIRNVNVRSHGSAEVVLFLGILYHLDQRDVFPVLKNIYEMCNQFMVIDTRITLRAQVKVEYDGRSYEGQNVREHGDHDPGEARRSRLLASVDNPLSFWFTKESLFRLLNDVGFTSVCECNVPLEPFKPENRITVIAAKGEPVQISSYPWVNDKTEDEIERFLADYVGQTSRQEYGPAKRRVKQVVESMVNGALRPFGIKISRIQSGPTRRCT